MNKFFYVVKVIDSCKEYSQLETCKKWIENLFFDDFLDKLELQNYISQIYKEGLTSKKNPI